VRTVEPADVLVRNARAYTVDDAVPRAEAVAIRGDRIAWVGADAAAEARLGPDTEVIDAAARTVLPGFIDSHNHVRLGSNPSEVDLKGARTLEELRARVRAHAESHPDQAWVEGFGWNYGAMPDALPTWRDLEGLTGGRPAFLLSFDAHNAWLNREAMRAFAITREVDVVPFGRVQKDDAGEPSGFVTDFAVMGIGRAGQAALARVMPGYGRAMQYERTLQSLDMATGFGITTIVEPQNSPDDLWIFERAREEGRLRSRLIAAMYHPVGTSESERREFEAARARLDDDYLRVGPIKLYIDDVVEPWTAAFSEPYANRPDTRGELFWEPEAFADLLVDLERRGFACHIHSIGDRGIRTVLDAAEAARRANGAGDRRHTMIHVECPAPQDLPRFAALGVIAGMQPRHAGPDITENWRRNVGPERETWAWPWRSLRDAGATLAFSSDWNVTEMDPMVGIYSAMTRAALDGTGAWTTDQTVDLETAIRAYTMGGAIVCSAEGDRGSITPGKYADIVLLSEDLFALRDDPRRILDVRVDRTIVAGQTVWAR
jgi:predicted amidohydrolase YtcJ